MVQTIDEWLCPEIWGHDRGSHKAIVPTSTKIPCEFVVTPFSKTPKGPFAYGRKTRHMKGCEPVVLW
jgi:hypothetical protein